jgi:hypothetical protein
MVGISVSVFGTHLTEARHEPACPALGGHDGPVRAVIGRLDIRW